MSAPRTSTAFAAKQAIVALFAAAVDETTDVHFNKPNVPTSNKEENVYVLDIDKGVRTWATLGGQIRQRNQVEEEYGIKVMVVVRRPRGDTEETEERAWAIGAQIELALAADASLGGLVQSALPGGDFGAGSVSGNDGWECVYSFDIAIKARL